MRAFNADVNDLAVPETNGSTVQVLGNETLRTIAQELVETTRRDATTD